MIIRTRVIIVPPSNSSSRPNHRLYFLLSAFGHMSVLKDVDAGMVLDLHSDTPFSVDVSFPAFVFVREFDS